MKTKSLILLVCVALALGTAALAKDVERPHEGKVVSIDKDAMSMTVQGDKNDTWTLYWTATTKLKGDLTVPELNVGDRVHFDYTQKDDRMWLTELKRTDKADH